MGARLTQRREIPAELVQLLERQARDLEAVRAIANEVYAAVIPEKHDGVRLEPWRSLPLAFRLRQSRRGVPAQPLFSGATDQLTSSVSPSVAYQRGRGYQEAVRAASSEENHEGAHWRRGDGALRRKDRQTQNLGEDKLRIMRCRRAHGANPRSHYDPSTPPPGTSTGSTRVHALPSAKRSMPVNAENVARAAAGPPFGEKSISTAEVALVLSESEAGRPRTLHQLIPSSVPATTNAPPAPPAPSAVLCTRRRPRKVPGSAWLGSVYRPPSESEPSLAAPLGRSGGGRRRRGLPGNGSGSGSGEENYVAHAAASGRSGGASQR